jgi:hypothetical protein
MGKWDGYIHHIQQELIKFQKSFRALFFMKILLGKVKKRVT